MVGVRDRDGLQWLGQRYSKESAAELVRRGEQLGLYEGELKLMRAPWQNLPYRYRFARTAAVATAGVISKILFSGIGGGEFDTTKLIAAVERAKVENRNIFTISNHVGTIDDPVIWGALPWWWSVSDHSNARWNMASQEICHSNRLTAAGFGLGKNLPTVRGAGINQIAISEMQEVLKYEPWCHLFPEAMCNQSGEIMPFKWGIGKLIATSKSPPIVLPLAHSGMETMYPEAQTKMYPRFAKLKVLTGNEIDVTKEWNEYQIVTTEEQKLKIYSAITKRVENGVAALHKQLYPPKL